MNMNRRDFLKDTALGAGSLAASMALVSVPDTTLAREPKKSYRVGIIGSTGRGSYGHGLDVVKSTAPW